MGGINQRILSVRLHYGLTQTEMAQKCEVSQSNQSRYEHNFDIPYSYLNKLLNQFPALNCCWLYTGRGSMFNSSQKKEYRKTAPRQKEKARDFDDIKGDDLTKEEADLLNEVEQFSNFLKTRGLSFHLKRSLLQLLIEHIDQAIQTHPDAYYDDN